MYDVRLYAPGDQPAWDAFNQHSKNGTFLFDRAYMEYHSDRFVDASAIVSDEKGKILALFPANRTGDRIVSHGGLTYGGMISDQEMTTTRGLDVFGAWLGHCRTAGAAEVLYKPVPAIYHRLPAEEDLYALFRREASLVRRDVLSVVDLSAAAPVQGRRRRGARSATAKGLEVSQSDDLAAFWRILEDNLASRHDRKPVHTLAEMSLLKARFSDSIQLTAAFDPGGEMCAGALLYRGPRVIHAQYIASTPRARDVGALDLLFTQVLEQVRGEARYFDFGNSNEDDGRYLNAGLCEFKEGFGARAVCQDFYSLALGRQ